MEAMIRPVIRCESCNLNQYETQNGKCRRCDKLLPVKIVTVPQPIEINPRYRKVPRPGNPSGDSVRGLGARIYFLRWVRGWSSIILSDRMGPHISRGNLSKIESSQRYPSLGWLEKVGDALGLPLSVFFEDGHEGTRIDGRVDASVADEFDLEVIRLIPRVPVQVQERILDYINELRQVTRRDEKENTTIDPLAPKLGAEIPAPPRLVFKGRHMKSRNNFINQVEKVWGIEYWVVNNDKYCMKLLQINPGGCCSLHRHPIKDETFYVNEGTCMIEVSGEIQTLNPGDSVHIPPETPHRFWVPRGINAVPCEIVEVSTRHDDEDVVRLEPSKLL